MFKKMTALFFFLLSLSLTKQVWAQSAVEDEEAAYEQIFAQAIEGPTNIKLSNQATFELPEGMFFLPRNAAQDYMDLIGNSRLPSRLGIVMADDDIEWYADILFENVGYISDKDAKNWNAEDMLEDIREGDEEQNKICRERGIPELQMTGWIEKPTYDEKNQRLVWSLSFKEVGENVTDEGVPNVVNYNTYVLGREGYIELSFITDEQAIRTEKLIAQNLLSRIRFNSGKLYSEYNAVTDKAAEYGLAALIGGGAVVKKLGLFGIIAAFLVKFWKVIVLVLVAIFPVLHKLRANKKRRQADSAASKSNLVE